MRKRLTRFEWQKSAPGYASGIGLRDLGASKARRLVETNSIGEGTRQTRRHVNRCHATRSGQRVNPAARVASRTAHGESWKRLCLTSKQWSQGRSSIALMTLTRSRRSDAALSNWTIIRQPAGSTCRSCRLAATLISARKRRLDVSSLLLGWPNGAQRAEFGRGRARATDEHGFTQMYEATTLSHPCLKAWPRIFVLRCSIPVNPWLRTIFQRPSERTTR
jgi:hypothetical protein